ncbi:histidinol-phosphatase [Marinobacter persicus]|uniref:Histidinol-phosphatase n=1 Tax=Marinobacter persicus TaxID=930118 RepID=A0A2S6G459_9GAMM|nr:HAD family hydrolase [Marinobacter persicus]PPK51766.1 HAD superfamily hydrolase (TIGR01490 family) [Marinobacter persicus]PPK53789.1 HAD superfamily hydrolase (TIGR01490 family) [Marinobacter persicus]PPK58697.1 HAD superfamily hydrolase (TIGR01490 family) [Marinobacter persicus]
MTLAIFDLDNTLLAGDSDHAWGEFLVEEGMVDAEDYKQANDRFYQEYLNGELDIFHYQRFILQPLSRHNMEELEAWREDFMRKKVAPMMLDKAAKLLAEHREQGHTLMIITATNRFITEPIAHKLGVEHLIATEPELVNGRFTGEVAGTPSFQEGKVERLNDWLAGNGESLAGAWFYSDSRNDVPLLEKVENPVAVDPDPTLEEIARERGWPVMSLRD